MRWLLAVFVLVTLSAAVWACGSDDSSAPKGDAGADVVAPVVDAGVEAAPAGPVFPAFPPYMPQVQNHGGATLKNPKIVTVTWVAPDGGVSGGDAGGDPLGPGYDSFGDQIAGSDYWKQTTAEYGISAATSGVHMHITDPAPATLDQDTELPKLVQGFVGGAPGNGWPVADANTVYMFYIPTTTKVTQQGADLCGYGVGGYHDETFITGNSHVVYGVVLQCADGFGGSLFDETTASASHEMVEASTDPHVQSDAAWIGLDTDDTAWDLWQSDQTEIGDMCEAFDQEFYRDPVGFAVQRMWSNASAKAGHDPCVPLPMGPYFNVTPLGMTDIVIKPLKGAGGNKAKGYLIPVGTTGKIQLGFYSDGPLGAWDLAVTEGTPFNPPTEKETTLSLDVSAGGNGDIAVLSVTVNKLIGQDSSIVLTATSTSPGAAQHYMPILITGK